MILCTKLLFRRFAPQTDDKQRQMTINSEYASTDNLTVREMLDWADSTVHVFRVFQLMIDNSSNNNYDPLL